MLKHGLTILSFIIDNLVENKLIHLVIWDFSLIVNMIRMKVPFISIIYKNQNKP